MNTKEAVIVVDYQNTFVPVDEGGTGELGVLGGGELAPYINKLTSEVRERGGLIINTRDEHPVGHMSLASSYTGKKPITEAFAQGINPNPKDHPEYFITENEIQNWNTQNNGFIQGDIYDYEALKAYLSEVSVQALWPDHAMQGEKNSKLLSAYQSHKSDIEIVKGKALESDSYSGFGGINSTLGEEAKSLSEILTSYNIAIIDIVGLATDYCVGETGLDSLKNGFKTRIHTNGIAGVDTAGAEAMIKKLEEQGAQIFN